MRYEQTQIFFQDYPHFFDPVIFMSCKLPVDPVKLVMKHVENVQRTGITGTK